MKTEVQSFFGTVRPAIENSLHRLLPEESTPPSRLHRAMRYSVFAGGKRLRPALCVAAYSIYRPDFNPVLPIAAALEMVHTYSLIHDDLPAMDNDDFRRGIPSCHKEFGEALAILAGDALLTLGFEIMASGTSFDAERTAVATGRLARALGTREGMIAGQVFDLEAEGQSLEAASLEAIHRAKTGALLSNSVWIGAFLGGASCEDLEGLLEYGRRIGLAFQIVDDILDETESREILGKTAGKDRDHRKATYPALFGVDRSREIVREVTAEARRAIEPLKERGTLLVRISEFLESRGS